MEEEEVGEGTAGGKEGWEKFFNRMYSILVRRMRRRKIMQPREEKNKTKSLAITAELVLLFCQYVLPCIR